MILTCDSVNLKNIGETLTTKIFIHNIMRYFFSKAIIKMFYMTDPIDLFWQ